MGTHEMLQNTTAKGLSSPNPAQRLTFTCHRHCAALSTHKAPPGVGYGISRFAAVTQPLLGLKRSTSDLTEPGPELCFNPHLLNQNDLSPEPAELLSHQTSIANSVLEKPAHEEMPSTGSWDVVVKWIK